MDTERTDDLLKEIVNTHSNKIKKQAEVWLRAGYQAFGIWGKGLLFCQPESAWDEMSRLKDAYADLTYSAPVKLGEQIVGTIGAIGGPETAINKTLLASEAALISEVLTIEARFEQAARELVAQARLKTEIDMAARIQSHLLPQEIPQIASLDIYTRCRPAERVGGDFYNFSTYKDHPLVFAIGDVSGKGLPAALLMAMTRIVLHTAARSIPTVDPKAILSRVNEDLYEYFSEVSMFATVFIGCYNARTAQLIYANAGHSPIIYCPAGGPATLLKADALVLGVLPTSTGMNHVLPFRTNDVLIAGTSSLYESFKADGEMFGYDRLLKTVETLAALPSREIGSELLNTIRLFTRGYMQPDDQTLIIIKGGVEKKAVVSFTSPSTIAQSNCPDY